jgi:Tol biopolymer transport system component
MHVAGPTGSELVWAWGPVGAGVAYASRYPGQSELLVFDPSDGTKRSLGRVDGQITAMSWTPDGNGIALAADGALYLVDLGSGERSRIATYQGAAGEMFSSGWPNGIEWSPDGTKFVLVTTTTDRGPTWTYPWSVQVLDVEGSQLFVLPVAGGGRFLGDPPQVGWSPDGSQLVYTTAIHNREKPHGNGRQIWTVASDGSNPTLIFDSGYGLVVSLRPTWSPDGSRLAYQVGRRGGIKWLVVDMGDIGEPHLTDELTISSWGGGSFSSEAWAPGQLGP